MPRLNTLNKTDAPRTARDLLEDVEKKLGRIPNIMGSMAHSPAVLEAYLNFSGALAKGALPAKVREQIALVVGEMNGCPYCLAAHAALGRMAGLNSHEITAARRGTSSDPKTAAVLAFVQTIVAERGWIGDNHVQSLRTAGLDDGAIAEIVANVALNLFTNYFNHVAQTEIDFPEVEGLEPAAPCACGV